MANMLDNRVAVITGAGNGLGRAEAIMMASQGAKVVVNDLGTSPDGIGASSHAADAVVNHILENGGTAIANYDSVSDEEAAERIIQTALDQFGQIDILVNNAGIIRNQEIYDIKTDDWDAVVKTHLYGSFYCTRAATRVMKERNYGRIICTSSHIGLGFFGQAAYSTVKEGIVGFARTVAKDMGKFGTTCNVIRPIAEWRGMADVSDDMARFPPEDVASLVVYLASESAGEINGCVFEVFKGRVAKFMEPQPIEQVLWKDGSWTPEELKKTLPQTLTRGESREVYPNTLPYMFDP